MLNELAKEIYQNNVDKGFYEEFDDIWEILADHGSGFQFFEKSWFGQRVALMHSELSEAVEANRKDLMDDKLPQYKGEDVELIDCLIRVLDTLGHKGVDIDAILRDKLEYNKSRPHKHGKAY